ncbi:MULTISPECIES: ABC transporter substrate-binding protein [Paenibacillus]|uniref:Extracellular solute-binding protein n=1 Tax=Paenibacillus oceani TaxID=2772510 RepID=A0A927CEY1_9BACL|nr:extracellular solute-binding protein [Paenibacillus oceani]MBD2866229.1 extracellular solute-binding protein [Paenibacillus oceani]MDF2661615.1 sugar transporter substrate-binding protein [Paenibacillus sp.]
MKFNKWLSIAMIFVFVIVAAACGKKEEPAPGAGGNTEQKQDTTPDTVKVWTYPVHGKYEDDIKVLISEFNKTYPHIKVEYEVLSWAEGPKKFDVALNAGNPPDLYFGGMNGQYVNTGLALPIDSYLTDEIKKDFLPGTLDTMKFGGKQYGLPLYQSLWGWGANKRILDEAGIDYKKIQDNGWTWEEFLSVSKKLNKTLPDGTQQYALVTDGTSLDFLDMVTRNAGLVDAVDEKGNFIWNDNKITDALKFINTLVKDGYMPKETVALAPAKRTEMFYAGQAAIISKAIPYYDVMIANRNKDIDAGKVKGEKIEYIQLPVPHSPAVSGYGVTTGGGEGYIAFTQKGQTNEQHKKNTFLVLDSLTGALAGNSANELCLPFVRTSQAKAFEGKGLAKEVNFNVSKKMRETLAPQVALTIDVDKAAKLKQYREQVQKPNFQALLAGEKTPEAVAEDLKTKGQQMLR